MLRRRTAITCRANLHEMHILFDKTLTKNTVGQPRLVKHPCQPQLGVANKTSRLMFYLTEFVYEDSTRTFKNAGRLCLLEISFHCICDFVAKPYNHLWKMFFGVS